MSKTIYRYDKNGNYVGKTTDIPPEEPKPAQDDGRGWGPVLESVIWVSFVIIILNVFGGC